MVQAQPNTQGGFICTRSEYNAKGQLVKTFADTGTDTTPTAATLYEYDSMGNVVKQTLALTDAPSPENSLITETSFGAESLADGVYSLTTTTRYNAAGQPLTSVQKQLISQLSATIENKSVFVSERGLTFTTWSEYSGGTKRTQYSTVPTSSITAEVVTVDGFTISQKDGTWYTYGWDLTKNICELYGQHGYIRTAYTYAPYGQVSEEGDVEQSPRGLGGGLDKPRSEFAPQGRAGNGVPASQPIQWSSEFNDTELGPIYYNYRHYNPVDGRWTGRDMIDSPLMYIYTPTPISSYDILGNLTMSLISYHSLIDIEYDIVWDMILDNPAKTRSYIVQRIIREISYEECDSYEYSIKNDRQDYWEAWLVYKNEMRPKTPDNMDIDTWYQELRRIKSKRGDVVLSSVAKVVPRSVTGNLGDQKMNTGNYDGAYSGKSAWKKDEYNSMSNNISSTNNKPSWWDSYNPQNEKIATQKLEIVWDFLRV